MAALQVVERDDLATLGAPLVYPGTPSTWAAPDRSDSDNGSGTNGSTATPAPTSKSAEVRVRNLRSSKAGATEGVSDARVINRITQDERASSAVLDEATAALRRLVVEQSSDEAEWTAAARLLRSAAVDRRLAAPRVASVALLASDAILFTPRNHALNERGPLMATVRLLLEPFVSQDAEERVFDAFLDSGWEVTPFHEEDGDELSDL